MVNPTTFPAQRRPGSGPFGSAGGSGSTIFEPFDNSFYFDPDYVNSIENGSIANPYTTWAQVAALAAGGTIGTQIYFPGYPITPGTDVIVTEKQLVIEGIKANESASYIADIIELDSNGGLSQSVNFRHIKIEGLNLNGGSYPLVFEHCEVSDIAVVAGNYSGRISSLNSAFLVGQVTPDAPAIIDGGYILSWEAFSFVLSNVTIGTPDLASAGELLINSEISRCRLVTFAPGSTVEFTGDPGQLYLDPASYRSFLDNAITIVNGSVVRDDGSFPINAENYTGLAIEIDWALNPRAYIEQDSIVGPVVLTFLPPLTREVVLIVDNTTSGENFQEIAWPSNCRFSGGIAPEQEGGISVYKLEYEEQLDVYFVYVVLMNALPEGI